MEQVARVCVCALRTHVTNTNIEYEIFEITLRMEIRAIPVAKRYNYNEFKIEIPSSSSLVETKSRGFLRMNININIRENVNEVI